MLKLLSFLKPSHKIDLQSRSNEVFDSINNALNTSPVALAQLRTKGYAVLPFLENEEVEFMNKKLQTFLDSFQNPMGELFYTSGRDEVAQRALARELTWPTIEPLLQRIINIDNINTEGCAWLLKPPSDKSSLSPHQDSSLIDETKFASFYGWIPIQDTQQENGCVYAVPGSHLWGNHYRSLDVPWMFENFTDILLKYAEPIEMKAGEILLFDSALIHGSYPNQSNKIRAALNLFFRPKDAYLVHYLNFPDTPKNKIESYKIDTDFFLKEDFRKRPNTDKYPFLGYVDQVNVKLSDKTIQKLYSNHK